MKKSAVLLTVIGTLLLSTNFASADQVNIESSMNGYDNDIKVISLEDIKEKSGNYEIIINQSTQQYNYLTDWGTMLRYLGSGKFNAIGYTETSQNVDTISTTIYLQQYDESRKTWVNIDNISNSASNYYYSSISRSYIVPIGFTYRLLAKHNSTVNGVTESISSYSSVMTAY